MPQVFHFCRIPGTDSILSILPQYIIKYHHDTVSLFLPYSRNKFKVAMRPYDVREVVESFGAGQVKDFKNIWKYFFLVLKYLERARWKILKTFENVLLNLKMFKVGQVKDSKNIWKCFITFENILSGPGESF